MRPPEIGGLIGRALFALARGAPRHYAQLAELLADVPLAIDVDGAPFLLRFEAGHHRLDPPGTCAATEVRADAATILALLDGRLGLVEAAIGERLWLRGSVERVSRFERALGVFMDGAVRCDAMPPLLRELRAESLRVRTE